MLYSKYITSCPRVDNWGPVCACRACRSHRPAQPNRLPAVAACSILFINSRLIPLTSYAVSKTHWLVVRAMSINSAYAVLVAAVVCEVMGTSALLACQQFTKPGPTLLVIIFYTAALVGISLTFRVIPMGIVYGLWSGLGIVLIAGIGWVGFGQRLDLAAVLGLGLILGGVAVINVFSESVGP
jgi:small multidrug resistance pump